MNFGKLVGDVMKEGGNSVIMKKVVDYCKSEDFKTQFGSQAESFKQQAEQALALVASGADQAQFAALVGEMKATVRQAGDKAIPVAVNALLEKLA